MRNLSKLSESDVLRAQSITERLIHKGAFSITVQQRVTSTNTLLREAARAGAPAGSVLCAALQTQGRGRLGRSFCSPAGGLYMSVLLRPALLAEEAALLTPAAAVAVCHAIEGLAPGTQPRVKWVNDIFLCEKKVCGILTEIGFAPSGALDYAVIGIGVNVAPPAEGFPPALQGVAGTVLDAPRENARSALCALISDALYPLLEQPRSTAFIQEYQERSLLNGRRVMVHEGAASRPATALAIDERCRLLVRYDDGETTALTAGEVSIKMEASQ